MLQACLLQPVRAQHAQATSLQIESFLQQKHTLEARHGVKLKTL